MSISPQQAWAYFLLTKIDFTLATKCLSLENIAHKILRTNKSIKKTRSMNSDRVAHMQKAKEILTLKHNVITLSTEYLHKNTCNCEVQ